MTQDNWPKRTFVVGGARSGKSAFAEAFAEKRGKPLVYIATAQTFDDEMTSRIAAHKSQRAARWRTVEAPLDAAEVLAGLPEGEVALFDCATLWLSNQMLAGRDTEAGADALVRAVRATRGEVIVVSNEVGQGIVPENPLARRFRDAQGRLNQHLAGAADLAVLVVAGLPLVLKGTLPEGAP